MTENLSAPNPLITKLPDKPDVLMQVGDLCVTYETRGGSLNAIDHLDLDLYRGEVLGLVGESGCGKSTLGRALMRMIAPPGRISSGQLIFEGADLMTLSETAMRDVRGRQISMIFQDPMTSLNPVQRIDQHMIEAIRVHEPRVARAEALDRAEQLMQKLGIAPKRLNDYPHQLSGGMRQRIMIGLALALKANLIIADEPTTSLDVIVEAQFLDLLRELKDEYGLTILLISHNIGIVAELADRVAVMYAGKIIELSGSDEIFHNPLHPYTQGLLKSIPNISLDAADQMLYRMEGTPPNLIAPPTGCRFHPRCPHFMPDICASKKPPLANILQSVPIRLTPGPSPQAERGDRARYDSPSPLVERGQGGEANSIPSTERIVGSEVRHLAACWLHIPHDAPEGK